MSVRYGIELALDPRFTARAYRTRQLVCGQYGCWAAEMHMLRMSLVSYFHCPDEALPALAEEIGRAAAERRTRGPLPSFDWKGISRRNDTGSITLNFVGEGPVPALQREIMAAVARLPGVRMAGSDGPFRPRVALLEYGGLPDPILADAEEYAREVAADLAIPTAARAWRLLVLRYASEAAGDDWSNGRWAADVSWNQLYSFPL